MKTILFTIALIGFAASGSSAQNTKSCTCKKTAAVHHKTVHHKIAVGLKTTTPPLYTNRTHNVSTYPGNDVWRADDVAPANGNNAAMVSSVEYNTESSYTGNYPKPTVQYTKVDPRENAAKGPEVNTLCLYNCK